MHYSERALSQSKKVWVEKEMVGCSLHLALQQWALQFRKYS